MIILKILVFIFSIMNLGGMDAQFCVPFQAGIMGSPGCYLSEAALLCQAGKQRHQLASLALSYPCLKMILCRWLWKHGDISSTTLIIVSEKWDFVRLRGERRWKLLLNKRPASAVGIDTSSSQLSPVTTKWGCICHASFSRLRDWLSSSLAKIIDYLKSLNQSS